MGQPVLHFEILGVRPRRDQLAACKLMLRRLVTPTLRSHSRPVTVGAGAYLTAALLGHLLERIGSRRCHCTAKCWCKRRGLRLFRWVLPVGHTLRR